MLPDVGGTELLVIAAVALIVVGPKDLPLMLRKLGEFMGKMRRMAADFRSSFDDMARQSELDDLRKEVESMRSAATQEFMAGEASVRDSLNIADHSMGFDANVIDPSATTLPDPEPVAAADKPPRKRASKPAASTAAAKPKAPAKTASATPRRKSAKSGSA